MFGYSNQIGAFICILLGVVFVVLGMGGTAKIRVGGLGGLVVSGVGGIILIIVGVILI